MSAKFDRQAKRLKDMEIAIAEDIEANLLNMVDIDALLDDPKQHLTEIAQAIVDKHKAKFKAGANMGKAMAKDILNG